MEEEQQVTMIAEIEIGIEQQVEAGGSGFVWTSSTASNVPSGYGVSTAYYLTNASTKSGDTTFEGPTGVNETGHSGDGYAKITWVSSK